MKKILPIFILFSNFLLSQKLDFGANVGYGFSNIANSKVTTGRAVIGSAMWKPVYGISAVYYFKNPNETITSAIGVEYKFSEKGSISENFPNHKIQFSTNAYNVFYRISGSLKEGFRFYGDLGLGFNTVDNKLQYYWGDKPQQDVFNNLSNPLVLNSSETNFLFGAGVEKDIYKEKLFVSLGFTGDAAITKIAPESFRTQGLGFVAGLKYELDLGKNKSN